MTQMKRLPDVKPQYPTNESIAAKMATSPAEEKIWLLLMENFDRHICGEADVSKCKPVESDPIEKGRYVTVLNSAGECVCVYLTWLTDEDLQRIMDWMLNDVYFSDYDIAGYCVDERQHYAEYYLLRTDSGDLVMETDEAHNGDDENECDCGNDSEHRHIMFNLGK